MTDDARVLLTALVEAVSNQLDGVSTRSASGGTAVLRAQRTFAVLRGGTLSVLLGGALASAAVRTPDAVVGVDGEGWVDFSPPRLDQYAEDRARAWLEAAWRRAG